MGITRRWFFRWTKMISGLRSRAWRRGRASGFSIRMRMRERRGTDEDTSVDFYWASGICSGGPFDPVAEHQASLCRQAHGRGNGGADARFDHRKLAGGKAFYPDGESGAGRYELARRGGGSHFHRRVLLVRGAE